MHLIFNYWVGCAGILKFFLDQSAGQSIHLALEAIKEVIQNQNELRPAAKQRLLVEVATRVRDRGSQWEI